MEHARKRTRDLETGDPNPPTLNLENYEERQERQFYMASPGPTNVHAPPPPVATPAPEVPAPGDACVSGCRTTFAACEVRCKENEPDPIDPKTQPPPEAPDAAQVVSAAKAWIGPHATEMIQDCVQLHGGIGVTWEHDLHLYLRRATVNRATHGTREFHAERVAATKLGASA